MLLRMRGQGRSDGGGYWYLCKKTHVREHGAVLDVSTTEAMASERE